MKRKVLLSLTGVVALIAGLTACDPKPTSSAGGATSTPPTSVPPSSVPPAEDTYGDGPVALKMWGSADDFPAFKKLATEYNKTVTDETKKIKLTVVGIGENDVGTKFGNDPTKGPDIFHFPGNNLKNFEEKGYISALTPADKVSIPESTLKTGKVDDALYGLPFTVNTYFYYYNSSLVTANDVKTLSGIMAKSASTGKPGLGIDIGNGFYIQSLIRSLGIDLYGNGNTDNGTTGMLDTNANAVAMGKFVYDIYHETTKYVTSADSIVTGVEQGKILGGVIGTWDYGRMAESLGDNFGMAVLPTLDNVDGIDDSKAWGSPIDNKFIGVNATLTGDKADIAKDFAYYMASDAGQKARYELRGTIPTAKGLLESVDFKADFKGADALNEYLSSTANFSNPTASKFDTKFWDAASSFAGKINDLEAKDETSIKAEIKKFGEALIS